MLTNIVGEKTYTIDNKLIYNKAVNVYLTAFFIIYFQQNNNSDAYI